MCVCVGSGKNHKDAASVRASHPIPAACGVYYFEIRVISKGRDGCVLIRQSLRGKFNLGEVYLGPTAALRPDDVYLQVHGNRPVYLWSQFEQTSWWVCLSYCLLVTPKHLSPFSGWEKNSYGYHADDGCVFNSSGTGQQYGPTFSTADVVGCGFNLVDRSVFFTKNGINLGQSGHTHTCTCTI